MDEWHRHQKSGGRREHKERGNSLHDAIGPQLRFYAAVFQIGTARPGAGGHLAIDWNGGLSRLRLEQGGQDRRILLDALPGVALVRHISDGWNGLFEWVEH